jgi:hypothetical protein
MLRDGANLDRPAAEQAVERAHLLYMRGRSRDALRLLADALAREPHNPEALELQRHIESATMAQRAATKEASRARDRAMALLCRVLTYAFGIGALILFGRFTGRRFHPVPAGPIVYGLHPSYWYAVGALVLAGCAFALWMLRSRWEPEWADLDQPDPKGVYGSGWHWRWWW